MNKSILIVEDEQNLGLSLQSYLTRKGFECHLAQSVNEAQAIFTDKKDSLKIVLMDIGLPDGSGLELAKDFYQKSPSLILIFLSAQNDPETRLEGLELGAYDYITKPFELRELTVRLTRILDNYKSPITDIQIGHITYSPSNMTIVVDENKTVQLNVKENGIFSMLIENIESVISRDDIISKVWGKNEFPSNRTVDNYIVRLRKIIETKHESTFSILSIRGVGYKATKL